MAASAIQGASPLYALQEYSKTPLQRRLDGQVCIITGANSELGIGRATAHQFARDGARALFICDHRDDNLEAIRLELQNGYPQVEVHVRCFDAASEPAVKQVIDDALHLYGRLDVFFANAGVVGTMKDFTCISVSDMMETLRVNVASVFLAVKYAAPAMMQKAEGKAASCGSIIATASVAGLRSGAGPCDYSASKAAVMSLMKTAAWQLTGSNIRCNSICPGLTETGMTSELFEAARVRGTERRIGQLNPLRRAAVADEVARVALFLASDDSSYVNGQDIAVDGGLSASLPVMPNSPAGSGTSLVRSKLA